MRIAIIGRTEILYETALRLRDHGHDIVLIVTAREAPEYEKTASDYRALAEAWGVPFVQTPRIEEAFDDIRAVTPIDIGVSLNYSGVIPQSVIDLFRLGILNAHGGDLPRYRGNACQAWAIINGEERIGLCIHRMIGGELDSGDIIEREFLALSTRTKISDVYEWMTKVIPGLFLQAVRRLEEDPEYVLERQSKNPADALRCYPRTPEDGRIDWRNSALDILRLINASNKPYSGAFCEFDAQKLIIWDAEQAPDENFLAIPGQVTHIGTGFIDIATGNGKLRVSVIEIDGSVTTPDAVFRSTRQRVR